METVRYIRQMCVTPSRSNNNNNNRTYFITGSYRGHSPTTYFSQDRSKAIPAVQYLQNLSIIQFMLFQRARSVHVMAREVIRFYLIRNGLPSAQCVLGYRQSKFDVQGGVAGGTRGAGVGLHLTIC